LDLAFLFSDPDVMGAGSIPLPARPNHLADRYEVISPALQGCFCNTIAPSGNCG
jgi:hypothetical protein